jgi:hypothetical protein
MIPPGRGIDMGERMWTALRGLLAVCLLLWGCREAETITYLEKQYRSGDSITVSGAMHRIGSAHFRKTVLVTEEGRRFIVHGNDDDLQRFEGRRALLTGTLRLEGLEIVGSGRKVIVPNIVLVTITPAE